MEKSTPPHQEVVEEEDKEVKNCSVPKPYYSPSLLRLWRPAAQRNLRNQWSRLLSLKDRWISASSDARSHATSLVNSHLSLRYMPQMDLGVLSEMPSIRQNACEKLAFQQEQFKSKLLSSYKDMLNAVSHMTNATTSMRCFLKGPAGSPLVQFGTHPEDSSDLGDGGGVSVFSSLPISSYENLGEELVQMYSLDLNMKRLLVIELLSISYEEIPKRLAGRLNWSDELYLGEFIDLSTLNLYSQRQCHPHPPRVIGWESGNVKGETSDSLPSRDILQVYLSAWLVEVNIDRHRVDEIFSMVGEEMHVDLS